MLNFYVNLLFLGVYTLLINANVNILKIFIDLLMKIYVFCHNFMKFNVFNDFLMFKQ